MGERNLFDSLVLFASDWPEIYKDKVNLEYRPVWYPENRKNMKENFRTCATERLFLPVILPEIDSVMYLDTDLILMVPPSELWNKFLQFNSEHLTAIGPVLSYYNTRENPVRNSI